MPKVTDFKGVEARQNSIRVTFHLNGKRRRETLRMPPTPKNMVYASTLLDEVKSKIALDVFTDEEYALLFPRSKHIGVRQAKNRVSTTCAEAVEMWLNLKAKTLAVTTHIEYRNTLRYHWEQEFGTREIYSLTYAEVTKHISNLTITGKTYNNVTGVIKAMLRHAHKCGYTATNLGEDIEWADFQDPTPDPMDLEEVEKVLQYLLQQPDQQGANYMELAFFSGLRPSELIALQWKDIDFERGQIHVRRARVRGKLKDTKTHNNRYVSFNSRTLAALLRQKSLGFSGEYVFVNPVTGDYYADTSGPLNKYWKPALKILEIRARDARQTRHTYATISLMAGLNPAYISKQMGHANAQMFFDVYSKWLDGRDNDIQRQRFDIYISAPNLPQNEG